MKLPKSQHYSVLFANHNQTVIQDASGNSFGYINSFASRAEFADECPPDVVSEVLAVWGDVPTMPDNLIPLDTVHPIFNFLTLKRRTEALESAVLAIIGGN